MSLSTSIRSTDAYPNYDLFDQDSQEPLHPGSGLLKSRLAQLRLAACGGKRGREKAWRGPPRHAFSLPFGVGWETHVTTFEKPCY